MKSIETSYPTFQVVFVVQWVVIRTGKDHFHKLTFLPFTCLKSAWRRSLVAVAHPSVKYLTPLLCNIHEVHRDKLSDFSSRFRCAAGRYSHREGPFSHAHFFVLHVFEFSLATSPGDCIPSRA